MVEIWFKSIVNIAAYLMTSRFKPLVCMEKPPIIYPSTFSIQKAF